MTVTFVWAEILPKPLIGISFDSQARNVIGLDSEYLAVNVT